MHTVVQECPVLIRTEVVHARSFSKFQILSSPFINSSHSLSCIIQPRELHLVARATTVASMLYAAPAWWGFAGEGDHQRLERLIARMRRNGYLPSDVPDLATLVEEADCKLYTNVRCSNTHVLRHYFI